jgi:twitching motility protein PilT
MAKIDAFFNLMFEQKASDLHMASGNPPMLRINGELQRVDYPPLESDALKAMLYEIAPDYKIKQFEETGDVDFGYEIPNISRFRVNFFNQKNGVAAVFRQIPSRVLSFEDFEKFEAPLPAVLKKFAMLHRGLVVVTGPTGSGKSTTLAAMVDYCNRNRKDHIITLEDPIEFVHESKNCLVNHREVGVHTKSFASAPARRAARRPGHHSRRRNARPGNHRTGHHRRRDRPLGVRHAAHPKRGQDGGPHH